MPLCCDSEKLIFETGPDEVKRSSLSSIIMMIAIHHYIRYRCRADFLRQQTLFSLIDLTVVRPPPPPDIFTGDDDDHHYDD